MWAIQITGSVIVAIEQSNISIISHVVVIVMVIYMMGDGAPTLFKTSVSIPSVLRSSPVALP